MTQRTWLGFDVGGANIKLAGVRGYTDSRVFPLWKHPQQLAAKLTAMIAAAPQSDSIVATMTGELADCFATKEQGVRAIVDALRDSASGRDLFIYLTDGSIVPADMAKAEYRKAAAANWHALASFAIRFVGDDNALLIDVGSTTCDVIPIAGGKVVANGLTDTRRLMHDELVYLGVERTPICAVVSSVPYRGARCTVARELFATTLDAHIVLGNIPEQPQREDTADGHSATLRNSIQRLARCICADNGDFTHFDAKLLAEHVVVESAILLRDAIDSVAEQHGFNEETTFILSGHGGFLFDHAKPNNSQLTHLHHKIGKAAARCGPAYAVAALAAETHPR